MGFEWLLLLRSFQTVQLSHFAPGEREACLLSSGQVASLVPALRAPAPAASGDGLAVLTFRVALLPGPS